MTTNTHPEYMSVEQAAAYLEVTPGAIRRLLRQHGLGDFLRASSGKQLLIRREDLDAIVEGHGAGQPTEAKPARKRRRNAA